MKTNDFTLESHLWTKEDIECPYELLKWLKELADIEYFQEQLRNYCCYTLSHKMYDKISSSEVIYDATVLQSIFKAGYRIYLKPKKFYKKGLTISEISDEELKRIKYLNKDECKNPYIVFENVFNRFTIEQVNKSFFDLILATMANSKYQKDYCCNVSMLVFHRLLEACLLIQIRDTASYR
ncbi:hypothetical protein HX071_17255 [Myroides marinus]|uniref:hypothetical protein n=1 Tax=Myroides marinus TaxID=703342 RepID=UPI002575DB07|nr:hypothetical protein [Myroides marinus]MDM1503929.1 hypothetical protein [Myroides marinus]